MHTLPAALEFTADGTPFCATYGDVYHSSAGGPGQARHVFLAGNGLPQRWRAREHFVIVETGFGFGLNFLATWAAWRADPQRPRRLHFVSCELHPLDAAELARGHAQWPQFAALAAQLRAHWPECTPGLHRLHLDGEQVVLSLCLGAAQDVLGQLALQADAFYLDGFSPARNPDMWSARLCHLLARLGAPEATLATWSVAGEVRENLRRAGFEVDKAPGFGSKRQMLRGVLRRAAAPAATRSPLPGGDARAAAPAARHALVIGAGLAGCAIAERLAVRGWTIELLDAAAGPAQGASGNHAGVLRPLPNLDDSRLSRLSRACSLYGWRHIESLRARGHAVRAQACGVLHLGRDAAQEARMQAVVERLALPPSHLRHVDAGEASALAGWALARGGWWFAGSGWVQPPSLCAANLAACGERLQARFRTRVHALHWSEGHWHALAADGTPLARAQVVVLAAGVGVRDFAVAAQVPLASARGQVSLLAAASASAPRVVVCRNGYVSPEVDGLRCAGATFDVEDHDAGVRLRDHRANLDTLEAMLPGYTAGLAPEALGGRVGFRPASPDRLPLVGALPAAAPGLHLLSGFGARGLVWSALCAELLACQIGAEPLPLERDLCAALDPTRFSGRAEARRRHG